MLFTSTENRLAQTISDIAFGNPFLPQRVELERLALGDRFDQRTAPFWSWTLDDERDRPNVIALTQTVADLTKALREKLAAGKSATKAELQLYADLVWYVLYYEHFASRVDQPVNPDEEPQTWDRFLVAQKYWMDIHACEAIPSQQQPEHIYACLHQVNRAFFNIFHFIIGRSWPICQLRARIWESIFTHDMHRARRTLYRSMNEVTTLISGATGTGKELVARAVGLSQYVPFDIKKKQLVDVESARFFPLNLSAFSPTLIESELFGHAKGSFTGAVSKRVGWLQEAGRYGTVFLDEIGELDLSIQVKLLRVLQERQFQGIGENQTHRFAGKFIAATNRNLATEIQNGTFREDFYYRLCSDVIHTPTLLDQLTDSPAEFEFLVDFLCRRIAPAEQTELRNLVLDWYDSSGLKQYKWPGNIRELDQCVRNIMIHNSYTPASQKPPTNLNGLEKSIQDVSLTADELLAQYCAMAYRKYGTYEKAAVALGMDRRTLRSKCQLLSQVRD